MKDRTDVIRVLRKRRMTMNGNRNTTNNNDKEISINPLSSQTVKSCNVTSNTKPDVICRQYPACTSSTLSTLTVSLSNDKNRRLLHLTTASNTFASRRSICARFKSPRRQMNHSLRAYGRLALISIRLCSTSFRSLEEMRKKCRTNWHLRNDMSVCTRNRSNVGFYPSYYKANRETKLEGQMFISTETRRILGQDAVSRTSSDISYLMIGLSNIPDFAEYPNTMRRKVCQTAWLERHEAQRIILKEGDPPHFFYFILSGKVLVTKFDTEFDTSHHLVTLEQGMSFGELAMITESRRQATVTTATPVELLCVSSRDFAEIFMAGGRKLLTAPEQHSFIRNVAFLKEWPIQRLAQNPQTCMFHYFNRGQVLVRDSNNSDWIYMVKSGSLSVLKKLPNVKARRKTREGGNSELSSSEGNVRNRTWPQMSRRAKRYRKDAESPEVFRSHLEADRRLEQSLPGVFNANERLGLVDYDRVISEYRARIQLKPIPETPSPKLPNIIATSRTISAPETSTTCPVTEDQPPQYLAQVERKESEANGSDAVLSEGGSQAISKTSKGVYLAPASSRRHHRKREEEDDISSSLSHESEISMTSSTSSIPLQLQTPAQQVYDMNIAYQRKFREHVGRKTMADQLDYKGCRDFQFTEVDLNPTFVLTQVLEKGQYFGVSQMLFDNQPSMSLVSNGAEVIVLSKRLFLEHASEACLRNIRNTESPFPTDQALECRLQDYVDWEAHRARVYRRLVTEVREKQARRKQYIPRIPGCTYSFRSGSL